MPMTEDDEGPHNEARTFHLLLIKLADISVAKADLMAKPTLKGW